MKKKTLLYGLLLVAILVLILYRYGQFFPGRTKTQTVKEKIEEKARKGEPASDPARREQFDRNTDRIIYTRHAKCRMGCRHIDETEVKEILKNGEINYNKSDMRAHPDPKYALEGITGDRQRVRIIFAPSPRGIVVITVIDLDHEWSCDCD